MLYRIYLLFLSLSIISCAISVSLSQLFLVISFCLFLFLPEKPNFKSPLVLIIVCFYSWQFVTLIFHFFESGSDLSVISRAFKAEMKDIFLASAFFCIQGIKKEDQPKLEKVLRIFSYIILITGALSVFSETRLSRLISDLYKTSSSWPYQHHYGSLAGIDVYLPIGLMNTHLTFGGLISFVFPYYFFQVYEVWKNKEKLYLRLLHAFCFLTLLCVFLFNNARSAMLGSSISIILGLYILIFKKNEISKKTIGIAFGTGLVLVLFLGTAYLQSGAVRKIIKPLFGSEKHTDSGRTFIWDSSFPLIKNNPIFGIGSGSYPEQIEISRKEKSFEHRELSFFYEVTQRGHAHNDYFHLSSVFGLPQVLLYILLSCFIVYGFADNRFSKQTMYWTIGLTGFFFSGLLQCYFQDDEVLIVFFYFLGYYHMLINKEDLIV
ncbi:O-antigen ligase family protein [Leptospira ilyithenensis]|uniref:O-antigen ligase domain-containing protein n=1 Tax=Leptospira ilyithenensis TaxID=2484901 RepID=A0A4V3JXH6_9LEPT|nr:O-antigen ligase family protein [Leptospira ilyithenensis]TGN16813.1 O-antigen ligase domain-containing protein [Leptospira ilyithenensis]